MIFFFVGLRHTNMKAFKFSKFCINFYNEHLRNLEYVVRSKEKECLIYFLNEKLIGN